MRLLITGSSGFIGKHVKQCLPIGIELLCIDYPEYNLHNSTAIQGVIRTFQPTHCLHLAWCAGSGYANAVENKAWVHSSLNLIQHFYVNGGRRFVGVGTCFEYAHTKELCDEITTPTVPKTAYGYAKLCVANYLQSQHLAEYTSFAWCRPFYVLGPCEPTHRLIPSACYHFLQNEDFATTNANALLDYMDVRDVARALVAVLLSSYDGIVNIGTGDAVTIQEMLITLRNIDCSQSKIIATQTRNHFERIIANINILQTIIQFNPEFTLKQSLSACYQSAKERINNERL